MVRRTVTRRPFYTFHTPLAAVSSRDTACSDANATYPITSRLRDIFTDLLGRETQWTDLRSECGRSTNLTSGGTEVNDLLLVGIEFWSWISHCH